MMDSPICAIIIRDSLEFTENQNMKNHPLDCLIYNLVTLMTRGPWGLVYYGPLVVDLEPDVYPWWAIFNNDVISYLLSIHFHSPPQSPLHLAVLTRQHKVIQYLLKANANPLVCDRKGDTPLHLACSIGFASGASVFVSRGNHVNTEGCRYPELSVRNNAGNVLCHVWAWLWEGHM